MAPLRNPSEIAGRGGPPPPDELLAQGIWLEDLTWSDMIGRIAEANPGARIVAWCHEDTPFIWSEIQHELAGCDPTRPLDGALDMAETIMTPEGYARLTDFLTSRDVSTEARRRRAVSAFLENHAIRDEIEAEIDLPGWTDQTIETLTEMYEEDVDRVAAMPGVTFVAP